MHLRVTCWQTQFSDSLFRCNMLFFADNVVFVRCNMPAMVMTDFDLGLINAAKNITENI